MSTKKEKEHIDIDVSHSSEKKKYQEQKSIADKPPSAIFKEGEQ